VEGEKEEEEEVPNGRGRRGGEKGGEGVKKGGKGGFKYSPKRGVFKISMIHGEPAIHKKLSQFAAFFIDAKAELSIAES